MKVENGHVITWLPRGLSTFQLLPVPTWRSAALNLPLFAVAAAVLLLSALAWLGSRLLGRGRLPANEWRLSRRCGLVGLVYLLSWAGLLAAVGSSIMGFDPRLGPWIRAVQLIGLGTVVAAGASILGAWRAIRGPAPRWAKLGAVAVALALVDVVWFSFVFGLISRRLNY
jgi:hypothetical protein